MAFSLLGGAELPRATFRPSRGTIGGFWVGGACPCRKTFARLDTTLRSHSQNETSTRAWLLPKTLEHRTGATEELSLIEREKIHRFPVHFRSTVGKKYTLTGYALRPIDCGVLGY